MKTFKMTIVAMMVMVMLMAGKVVMGNGVKIQAAEAKSDRAKEALEKYYPALLPLYEEGVIGVNIEQDNKDYITMGKWDMDIMTYNPDAFGYSYNPSGGDKENLVWEVLTYSKDGKKALVISRDIIVNMPFNKTKKEISWKSSSIRKWLNSTFYSTAFTDDERGMIAKTTVKNKANSEYGTSSGKTTKDYIFLLSEAEFHKYIMNKAENENYAGVCTYMNGYSDGWWLRTSGYKKDCAMIVSDYGKIERSGNSVFDTKWKTDNGVRPVFWINLTDEMIRKNNLSVKGRTAQEKQIQKDEIYITMGTYDLKDENNDGDGIEEEVEWQILDYDEKNGKALLVSRYILCQAEYNAEFVETTWEKCSLRKWMNENLYNDIFSAKEKTGILKAKINNHDTGTKTQNGGNDTEDRLFLLSIPEAVKYYNGEIRAKIQKRICSYYDGIYGVCWLRTPGEGCSDATAVFSTSGYICEGGFATFVDTDYVGVRPAMYLKLEK